MSGTNSFDAVNRGIWAFVHERANRQLMPGTGSYSAIFRGSLFGEDKSAAVTKRLASRDVDVLWLGMNPCMPRSLEYILAAPNGQGDLPTFERQMNSGLFGSWRWGDDRQRSADWNPIEGPTGSWKVYRDVLAKIARLDCVAMANFLPWGSQNAKALVQQLAAANRPLLEHMLEFADDLNARIIQVLAPKLVVVPFSLGRSRGLDEVRPMDLTLARAKDIQKHTVGLSGRTFNFYTARCQRGRRVVSTAFLGHPSSLRLSNNDKTRVVEGVSKVLAEL